MRSRHYLKDIVFLFYFFLILLTEITRNMNHVFLMILLFILVICKFMFMNYYKNKRIRLLITYTILLYFITFPLRRHIAVYGTDTWAEVNSAYISIIAPDVLLSSEVEKYPYLESTTITVLSSILYHVLSIDFKISCRYVLFISSLLLLFIFTSYLASIDTYNDEESFEAKSIIPILYLVSNIVFIPLSVQLLRQIVSQSLLLILVYFALKDRNKSFNKNEVIVVMLVAIGAIMSHITSAALFIIQVAVFLILLISIKILYRNESSRINHSLSRIWLVLFIFLIMSLSWIIYVSKGTLGKIVKVIVSALHEAFVGNEGVLHTKQYYFSSIILTKLVVSKYMLYGSLAYILSIGYNINRLIIVVLLLYAVAHVFYLYLHVIRGKFNNVNYRTTPLKIITFSSILIMSFYVFFTLVISPIYGSKVLLPDRIIIFVTPYMAIGLYILINKLRKSLVVKKIINNNFVSLISGCFTALIIISSIFLLPYAVIMVKTAYTLPMLQNAYLHTEIEQIKTLLHFSDLYIFHNTKVCTDVRTGIIFASILLQKSVSHLHKIIKPKLVFIKETSFCEKIPKTGYILVYVLRSKVIVFVNIYGHWKEFTMEITSLIDNSIIYSSSHYVLSISN